MGVDTSSMAVLILSKSTMTSDLASDISLIYQSRKPTGGEEMPMKKFSGDRTIDGVKVWVDGRPLDQRLDIHRYTGNGFEWSYEGDEPRQLALAVLAEHLGDAASAQALVEPFMKAVVANFDNEWEMTSADIDAAVAALRGGSLRAAS
jgi:uncharacterized protein DUF6166